MYIKIVSGLFSKLLLFQLFSVFFLKFGVTKNALRLPKGLRLVQKIKNGERFFKLLGSIMSVSEFIEWEDLPTEAATSK